MSVQHWGGGSRVELGGWVRPVDEGPGAWAAWLVSFVRSAPFSIAMFDRGMNYVATSADWLSRYGRGHGDIIGRNHYELYPDMPEWWKSVHRRALAGETVESEEDVWNQGDGTSLWLRWAVMPWRDSEDEIGGLLISAENITELKEAQAKARLFEKGKERDAQVRLASLIEHAPDGIFVVSVDGHYVEVNEAGCRMLGYSREEIIGKIPADFIVPAERERLGDALSLLFREGTHVEQFHFIHKNGTCFPIEVSACALPDGRKQAFFRDISERERAFSALRRAEAISSGVLFASADAIVCVDKNQRVTLFNRGAQRIFGYSQDEVLGAPLEILIPERFRAAHGHHVARFAAQTDIARRMDTQRPFGLRKNGEEFPLDASISKVQVGDEVIFTVAVRDVSEQRRIDDEHELLAEVGAVLASFEYEDPLRELMRACVRWLCDYAVLFVVEEGELRRVTAGSRDPAKAWCAEIMMQLQERPRPEHPVARCFQTKSPISMEFGPERYESIAESPEHMRALLSAQPKYSLAVPLCLFGKCVGVLGFASSSRMFSARDVSLAEEVARRCALFIENARLHKAEQRAIKVRDEVLGIVAHDLRNPLSSIVLQSALLQQRGSELDQRSQKAAGAIMRAATRMNNIIEDLLDVTRIEAGQLAIERIPIAASKIIADVAEAQQAGVIARSLSFRIEAPSDLPEVLADKERIYQVFENLVGNALKFTRGGGISLGAERREGEVVFRVADTGAGIPAESIPHLFDRFWQVHKATRSGAGLGLAIVKGIVEAHGGRVWIESQVGVGSTFSFTLPTAGA